jgi:insertion element IS1 protein InsB
VSDPEQAIRLLRESVFDLPEDAVELDAMCVSFRHQVWLWTAVSRYSGQILAFVVSDRSWGTLDDLRALIPPGWERRATYADRYGAYDALPPSRHTPCEKFDGGTCTAEGVNNALRHRCGALVRRTSARCRSDEWLGRRVAVAVVAHNNAAKKRYMKRIAKATQKRQ